MGDRANSPDCRESRTAQAAGLVLGGLCKGLAFIGGAVLVALTVMTVASILGRGLFAHPVPGDFELVEIGCAIAVFCFLPYCQFIGGNVAVDFFTNTLPHSVRTTLDILGSLTLSAIAAVLAWRMTLGAEEMQSYGETTMILGLERWWGFIPMILSCALLAVVSIYTALRTRAAADILKE